MPSSYAHLRFGQLLLPELSGEIGKNVRRFPQMFRVGLHGPDLFFYYNPLFRTKVGRLGSSFHRQTGREFFGNAALTNPPDAGRAYLFGVLAHYALDTACHPFVEMSTAGGEFSHTEMEVEFDRFLLELDGKLPPCTQDVSTHLHLTRGEAAAVSRFYPPASAHAIGRSVRNMRLVTHALASPNREVLERVFRLGGKTAFQMVMPQHTNSRCAHLNEAMLERFRQGIARYPGMARQLEALLSSRIPLGDEFAPDFC